MIENLLWFEGCFQRPCFPPRPIPVSQAGLDAGQESVSIPSETCPALTPPKSTRFRIIMRTNYALAVAQVRAYRSNRPAKSLNRRSARANAAVVYERTWRSVPSSS